MSHVKKETRIFVRREKKLFLFPTSREITVVKELDLRNIVTNLFAHGRN